MTRTTMCCAPGAPLRTQTPQPGALQGVCRGQAQRRIKPEARPLLQVLAGPVFTVRWHPGHFQQLVGASKQRRAPSAATAQHHAGLGQLTHSGLGDGGAGAQQHRGDVGGGDVAVQRLHAFIGDALHPPTIDQHAAVLQAIQVGAFGLQDGLQVACRHVVHGLPPLLLGMPPDWRACNRSALSDGRGSRKVGPMLRANRINPRRL